MFVSIELPYVAQMHLDSLIHISLALLRSGTVIEPEMTLVNRMS